MKLKPVDVVNALGSLSASQMKQLVYHLGVDLAALDDIDSQYSGVADKKTHYVQTWLDGDLDASWDRLASGLRHIKLNVLASDIESKYCMKTSTSQKSEPPAAPTRAAHEQEETRVTFHAASNAKNTSDDFLEVLRTQLKQYTKKARPTGKTLGSGAYGSVIELVSGGEVVAGKVFRVSATIRLQGIATKVCGEVITMLQLTHLNIVRCKGVSLLPDQSPLPVLLMERLITSLHDYLLSPDNSNLPVERKVSFLLDTARGLEYLHSCSPAIIHRDLTATNVLLDSKLRAKIADFGNSRMVELDPNTTPTNFTSIPGTLEYMPPEAQGDGSHQGTALQYNPSLDIFSFGHLFLFTIMQSQVSPLPPTYTDSEGMVHGRSEVARREQFIRRAEVLLFDRLSLLRLMKQCLHNLPAQRPLAKELVKKLSFNQDERMYSGTSDEEGNTDEMTLETRPITPTETRHELDSAIRTSPKNRVTRGAENREIILNRDSTSKQILAIDNLQDARSALQQVIHRWKHIGLALRLDHGQLKKIEAQYRDLDDCLTEMLSLWLNKNYNTERFGEPSWELLATAVGDPSGGNDTALAEKIMKDYKAPQDAVEDSSTRFVPQKLDIERDVPVVKKYLKNLQQGELRDLFQELGLYYSTVHNYTGTTQQIAEDLIRLWILGKDDVLKKDKYFGSTMDDLKRALQEMGHHGIAASLIL